MQADADRVLYEQQLRQAQHKLEAALIEAGAECKRALALADQYCEGAKQLESKVWGLLSMAMPLLLRHARIAGLNYITIAMNNSCSTLDLLPWSLLSGRKFYSWN